LKAVISAISAFVVTVLPLIGNAGEPSLREIDASFIKANFALSGVAHVREEVTSEPFVAGCEQYKRFLINRKSREWQLNIALCDGGQLGPRRYEASVEAFLKPLTPAHDADDKTRSEAKLIMGGTVPLSRNRVGRTFLMPFIGHGIVLIPTAIAPTVGGNSTLLIQSDLSIEIDPELLEIMATLLRAVDAKF